MIADLELKTKKPHYIPLKQFQLQNANNPHYDSNAYISDFPTADKITPDKLREVYTILHFAYRDLTSEKESILESLRNETLQNEEQKNYIEMLKQAIESSIIKHGLAQFFNSQKFLFYKGDKEYADMAIDFNTLTKNLESVHRDLNSTHSQLSEKSKENEMLIKANAELIKKKTQIIKTLDIGIKELEEAKDKVNVLEKEKEEIITTLLQVQVDAENLKHEYNNLSDNYEKDISDYNEKINDLSTKIEEYDGIEKTAKKLEQKNEVNSYYK